MSDTSTDLAALKRAFLAAADRKILVADRTKFPKRSLCLFAGLQELDAIVVDAGIDPALASELAERNPRLELAGEGGE